MFISKKVTIMRLKINNTVVSVKMTFQEVKYSTKQNYGIVKYHCEANNLGCNWCQRRSQTEK
jgi:hypothetical protein